MGWIHGPGPRSERARLSILIALSLTAMFCLAAVLPSVLPSKAHDTPYNCVGVSYGGHERGVACTHSSHTYLDGCDRYSDGLRVRAWAAPPYPYDPWPGSWDPNGAASGCANDYTAGFISYHRICVEQPVGCSGWKVT